MQQEHNPPSTSSEERPVSYEECLVLTALELGREIARHFEQISKLSDNPDHEKEWRLNSNRAYASVDNLRLIEFSRV